MAGKRKKDPFTPLHEKFCQHYAEYGNATQAYLFAWPKVAYSSAKSEGCEMAAKPYIKERIEQIKEEFAVQYNQTKAGTVRDLINAAEEATAMGQFPAYAKLREMVIKMCGFYEPDKIEVSGSIDFELKVPGVDKPQSTDDEDQEDND